MKKIVTVGGGTGSYTVLSGLKHLKNVSLTAIVSMADNGGSTRILRDELGVLPPGDVRQCLVALSEHSDVVRKLMSYRFDDDGTLKGHSFGNILLAALEKVTGDFATGVEVASEILKVEGTVVPVTKNKTHLCAMLGDGTVVKGQIEIDDTDFQKKGLRKIFYEGRAKINDKAIKEILTADYIVLGPGNFYESVVPNLLVEGFRNAIQKTKAKLIFPINLTNKKGHTKRWNVSNYVVAIEEYLGRPVDFVLINNEPPSKEQVRRYELKEGNGVLIKDDFDDPRAIRAPLISHAVIKYNKSDARAKARSYIRHDSTKIASCVEDIIKKTKK
ncbi:MAG TPA: gluconeogenesis factor YvcK family protein [Candidatus Paceibacterota bacterium]|nr:gluconeogenesis factor YvcK family protein [Candidatus Paceibacterota bacterium]